MGTSSIDTDKTAADALGDAATLCRLRAYWDGMIASGLSVGKTRDAMSEMLGALRAGDVAGANAIARRAMTADGLAVAEARMVEFRELAKKAFAR